MEVVRQFVEANNIMNIIRLPDTMLGKKLEVIVMPAEETNKSSSAANIEEIVDSLTGCIPDEGMTLDDYRAERLRKYEALD